MSLALVRMIKDLQAQLDRLEARVNEMDRRDVQPVTVKREKLTLPKKE